MQTLYHGTGWSSCNNRFRAVDNAGNVSEWSSSIHIHMDTEKPSAPTITYNSGSNECKWENNINMNLSSSDNVGISYYQADWNGDGVPDGNYSANFIPGNGHHSCNNRFRAVDHAGNVSDWSSSVHIHMDTEAPTYTSAEIKNQTATGYDIYVYGVQDSQSGVNRVQFPTWTTANGQDDMISDWTSNSKASGTKQSDGTTWIYHVSISDHNNESGEYNTHVYVWDNCGNGHMIYGTTVNIQHTHSYTAQGNLRSAATCQAAATYWYKCSICGAQGDTYFSSGSTSDHSWGSAYDANTPGSWTCATHGSGNCKTRKHNCTVCGTVQEIWVGCGTCGAGHWFV